MFLAAFFSVFVSSAIATAMETDQITCRQVARPDVSEVLNQAINAHLNKAKLFTNKKITPKSSFDQISERFRKSFREQFKGHYQVFNLTLLMETWMETELLARGYSVSPTLDGRTFHIYDQYRVHLRSGHGRLNAAIFETTFRLVGRASANSFNVGGVLIGSDKLGHFIDQGYDYWLKSNRGQDDRAAIRFGTKTELGFFGYRTTGVFSYADLAANNAGYRLFKELIIDGENSSERDKAEGLFIFSRDKEGKPHVVPNKPFDIRNYVTSDWDEAINFSVYTQGVSEMVKEHLEKYACVVCAEYEQWRDDIRLMDPLPKELYVDLEITKKLSQVDPYQLDSLCVTQASSCEGERAADLRCWK